MITKEKIAQISFNFRTSPKVEAPYSYQYQLQIEMKEELELIYNISYTNREGLSEEEILEEGFSLHDDLQTSGKIKKAWLYDILELLKITKPETQEQDDFLEISIKYQNNEVLKLYPNDVLVWQYLLQELVQALFEANQIESPLFMAYQIRENKQTKVFKLEASFAERIGKIQISINGKHSSHKIQWQEVRELLDKSYNLDYEPEEADAQLPNRNGFFIQVNDWWFEANKAVFGENLTWLKSYLLDLGK